MHYVYMIQSEKSDFIYIGNTNDIKRRFVEHNHCEVGATKRYAPLRLVYYGAYADEADALDREYKLKHHGSVIGHLKKRLKHSLAKNRTAKRAGFNSQTSLTGQCPVKDYDLCRTSCSINHLLIKGGC